MPGEIRVHVIDYGADRNLVMRYTDPVTGKQHARSTGTRKRKDAEKAAAVWESQLRAGQYKPDGRMPWEVFRQQFNEQHVNSLRASTDERITSVLNLFAKWMSPATLNDVSAAMISKYQAKLREAGRAEDTIATHTATIRAALNWAHDMGYLREVPKLRRVARVKRGRGKAQLMKGRPLTDAEFALLLASVSAVVGDACADGWRRFLRGLWLSGLRLEEAVELSWDDPTGLMVDLTGRRPMLQIQGDAEKGGQTRLLPIAPEFARMLLETSPAERTGRVFPLPKRKKRAQPITADAAGRIVSEIGEKAGIVVDPIAGKFASAHDLRRSFGSRWATRVMPQVLMELMRHADISTTLRYYVGINAERTADVLWSVVGEGNEPAGNFGISNDLGNTACTG